MVHMIQKPQFNSESEIEAYYNGYANGVMAYAHWKDGQQYVGTCNHNLQNELNHILSEKADEYERFRTKTGNTSPGN